MWKMRLYFIFYAIAIKEHVRIPITVLLLIMSNFADCKKHWDRADFVF